MPTESESLPLNVSSFSNPVTRAEIRAYQATYKTRQFLKWAIAITLATVVYMMFVSWQAIGRVNFGLPLPFLIIGLIIGCIIQWLQNKTIARQVQFKRFAADNNFEYTTNIEPHEAGAIFNIGHSKHADAVVSGLYKGKPFWFGSYYYTVGSGKNSRTVVTGVLNVALPRAVPYVIVDGNQNRMNAAAGIDKSQQLVLEGDFNNYFKVYCPKDYERDVLYFLTPELMQALVDMDDSFDAEIKGTELYFYTRDLVRPTAQVVTNLFTLIDKVGGEIVENTQRYQDYRIDKKFGTIAASGLTLKKSLWPTVIAVLFLIFYILNIFY